MSRARLKEALRRIMRTNNPNAEKEPDFEERLEGCVRMLLKYARRNLADE